jgi:hypothetical protein
MPGTMRSMPSHLTAITNRRAHPDTGSVVQGQRIAQAAWPLGSALALLAVLVLVVSDTSTQQLRAHDVAQGLSRLLRL